MARPASEETNKPFKGFSRDELIADLIAELNEAAPHDDEFAAIDFAKQAGTTVKKANYQLECLLTAGRLQRRKGVVGGRSVWLYSAANK
jgi:hypothetical protein